MKDFRLQSLWMLSTRERAGRLIEFHPRLTLLRGSNDTGKSSILKTIFQTLGATPHQISPRWKEADVHSLVRFTLDRIPYAMLRTGDRYSLFGTDGQLIVSTTHITAELAPIVGELFGFNLHLQTRDGSTRQAPPAFLFAPYYIDQDTGWVKSWDSFDRLGQFADWKRDVIDYHIGIRTGEYYIAKGERASTQAAVEALELRRNALEALGTDLEALLERGQFDLDFSRYDAEVESLLIQCNELKLREDQIKRELTAHHDRRALLHTQMLLVDRAIRELQADYDFAARQLPDEVECPTCGTVHQNSFAERYAFARDEQRCHEIQLDLQTQLDDCQSRLDATVARKQDTTEAREQIEALLETREGDITLRDLIVTAGRNQAKESLISQLETVRNDLVQLALQLRELEGRLATFDDAKERDRTKIRFVGLMSDFLSLLNIASIPERRYQRLDCHIPATGSELPRSLLAYFFAIIHVIRSNRDAIPCPIVLDAPRQQDPDPQNWNAILRFLRLQLPEGSQTVLALGTEAEDMDAGRVYEFSAKRQVLLPEEYDLVRREVMPFVQDTISGGLFGG